MIHGHNDRTDTQPQGHRSSSTETLSHMHFGGHALKQPYIIHKLSGTHKTQTLNIQTLRDAQEEMVLQTSHVLTNAHAGALRTDISCVYTANTHATQSLSASKKNPQIEDAHRDGGLDTHLWDTH